MFPPHSNLSYVQFLQLGITSVGLRLYIQNYYPRARRAAPEPAEWGQVMRGGGFAWFVAPIGMRAAVHILCFIWNAAEISDTLGLASVLLSDVPKAPYTHDLIKDLECRTRYYLSMAAMGSLEWHS